MRRITPSLIISVVALFVALGGAGYAAVRIGSAQIKDNTVRSRDIRNGTRDVSNGARAALKGNRGDRGEPGASVFSGPIPSGTTIAGGWGGRYIAPQLAANNSYLISTSFPVRAPTRLSDAQVNTAANAAAGDRDAACTGSVSNPTAPAGKVCIYIARANNAQIAGFRLTDPGVPGAAAGDAYGFIVRILDTGTVGNTAGTNAEGTWAYTAP